MNSIGRIGESLSHCIHYRRAANRLPSLCCLAFSTVLVGCAGYVPGRQAYWDEQVKAMCDKDGGTAVYEKVELSEEEYRKLGGVYGVIPVPAVGMKTSDYPYVRSLTETKLREGNPEVVRTEELIMRRSDGKVLVRSISYSRRGGDFPTGLLHDTVFRCPKHEDLSKRVFSVRQGGAK